MWTAILQQSMPSNGNDNRELGLRLYSSDARLCRNAAQGKIQGNLQIFSEIRTLLALAILGVLYGSIHASSWNGHFPTRIEQIAWQTSTCVVMGGGIIVCILDHFLRHLTKTSLWPLGKGSYSKERTVQQKVLAWAFLSIINSVATCCTIARCYLVFESLASFRSLPVKAYSTVPWASLFQFG